ncbi:MAG: cell division protein FtsQ [Oceanicoccus sp.]|jgi:cell division protein FtsQ
MKGKGATRQASKKSIFEHANVAGLLKPLSIGVTVISILVAVVLLLLQAVNKQVNQLQVNENLEHVTSQMVNEHITQWFPDGYVTLNVNAIKDRLHSMVMVAEVSVEKVWPDTLKINIVEERPVAIWNDKSLLSENGDILPVELKQLQLPKLNGANQESKMVMQHFLLFNRWGKRHQIELTGIKHSSAGWMLQYKSGLTIWLDSTTAMNGLQQLDSVIEQFDLARIKRIDMRYEQGFAVAWKDSIGQAQG